MSDIDKNNLSKSDKRVIALTTVFGVGYVPLLPGTAACVVAILPFVLIKSQFLFLLFTIATIVVAYKFSTQAESIFGEKDCKKIVIDDFAGMLVTMLFIPHDIKFILVGFFLFRMLDILKVPPANKLEKFPGAKGIVGDDMIAGIYANIILHIAKIFI